MPFSKTYSNAEAPSVYMKQLGILGMPFSSSRYKTQLSWREEDKGHTHQTKEEEDWALDQKKSIFFSRRNETLRGCPVRVNV